MKPIRSSEDHRQVLEEIASLMGAAPGTPEAERLEILAMLASDYERREELTPEADPVDLLGVAMRGKGLSQAELADVLGSRARASEVLSRRRGLSSEMIERVARAWAIPRRLLAGPPRAAAPRGRGLRTTATVFLVGLSVVAAAGAAPFALYGRDLPDIAPLVAEGLQAGDVAALPPHLIQAFIAGEDKNFLRHGGSDPVALGRAAGVTLARAGDHPEGGATLTEQLLKNTLLAGEGRTVRRKVREVLLSHRLEAALSKDQILRLYLNHAYFGGGAWGLDAAAHHYFGRAPAALSVGQAAYLASLVDAPDARRFDRPANRPRALAARDQVVARMARDGFLTPALAQAATRERLWQ